MDNAAQIADVLKYVTTQRNTLTNRIRQELGAAYGFTDKISVSFSSQVSGKFTFFFNGFLTRSDGVVGGDKEKWVADHDHLRETFLDNTHQERFLVFLSKAFIKEVSPQLRKDSDVTTYRYVFPRLHVKTTLTVRRVRGSHA